MTTPMPAPAWLLLITNLPGHNPTLRMRSWRALKAAGAGRLRDGAYLLPSSEGARQLFAEQADQIRGAGGSAHLLCLDSQSPAQRQELVALFDLTAEYGEAIKRLDRLKRELAKLAEPNARHQMASIGRDVASLVARDFFPGEPRRQVESALANVEAAINSRFAPDEPHSAHLSIRVRKRKDYRKRTWATRQHLWADRVASAWLIRRFIDPEARFLWLKRTKDCPRRALGFDFDGAEFTHVHARVTFEVLLASFELDKDAGLNRLGSLVHHLDVGGIPVAEAAGFAVILAGARSLQPDDDALLRAMTPVLDSLYAGFKGADVQ